MECPSVIQAHRPPPPPPPRSTCEAAGFLVDMVMIPSEYNMDINRNGRRRTLMSLTKCTQKELKVILESKHARRQIYAVIWTQRPFEVGDYSHLGVKHPGANKRMMQCVM